MLREKWPLWKAGLYGLEVVLPWGCCFWTGGLAYDTPLLSIFAFLKNMFKPENKH